MRIHLSGLITIEGEDATVRPPDFPSQQGRAAFAFLVGHRDLPVPRGELAEALWPPSGASPGTDSRPEAWESALGRDDFAGAYGPSAVAHHISARPFLPGQDGRWFEERRERLAAVLVRALECRARIYLWNEEPPLAVEAARELVRLRPFRESGHRLLMRAHAAAGNAAEALRVYERCRALIAEELGVPPSPETRALHGELLAAL